jgi:hypothetical protein
MLPRLVIVFLVERIGGRDNHHEKSDTWIRRLSFSSPNPLTRDVVPSTSDNPSKRLSHPPGRTRKTETIAPRPGLRKHGMDVMPKKDAIYYISITKLCQVRWRVVVGPLLGQPLPGEWPSGAVHAIIRWTLRLCSESQAGGTPI